MEELQPTEKQLELLLILNPYKKRTAYKQAAKELGINVSAVQKRMDNLKKRCPEIYKKFMLIKKDFNKKPIFCSYGKGENKHGMILPTKTRLFEDDY